MKLKDLRKFLDNTNSMFDEDEVVLEGSDHSYNRVTHALLLPARLDGGDLSECDPRATDGPYSANATVLVLR